LQIISNAIIIIIKDKNAGKKSKEISQARIALSWNLER
jgi:hypothetical protein